MYCIRNHKDFRPPIDYPPLKFSFSFYNYECEYTLYEAKAKAG
jgi:hypothetical protein